MPTNVDKREYLDPETISRIENLSLVARLVVEGFIIGLHKSPYHGFSVEFAEHRQYMPGDEIKHIDWKLYGKTDRYYVKQFEEETNLKAHIVLDASQSMGFGETGVTKLQYGSYLGAALTYLMLKQQDAVGLTVFDHGIRSIVPPSSRPSYLNVILGQMDGLETGRDTNIAGTLHELADRVKRRGLIILISDLLDDPDEVITGLKHFRHKKHEVLVFHILDRQEIEFQYDRQVELTDMESGEHVTTEPRLIQSEYRREMEKFIEYYRQECLSNHIDYVQLTTDQPFDISLTEYLNKRQKLG
ncbi:MAG: DUF58 domain-containing protein [Candidatus Marinimicrobia bacterium]|nr:DUF58 domain-containing protein [Candidatus Neomarinimicrobiota bacterium]MCF7829211.1 DUF58 domain-containing protein [Candidatus Neomarinimicrobiota bacterium]MCF7881136.1 DUF58 domain-containing protein [Candidatus Neomarinimicrobiota bacterium]